MTQNKRYLLTSALPYANGPIHLGHLAGAYLPGDIFARYCRLKKRDVVYICGSDEHGVPIMLRARKEGKTPQEVVDRFHAGIEDSFRKVGMSFDYYGRTSSPVHYETSQEFFQTLAAKDAFVLKTNEQLFDPEANMFLADRFIRGTCPKCGHDDAYGDQCENCGSSLSPSELINPRSAVTNATPVKKETTHWYLPLGDIQPDLEEWIATHPEWRNHVLGQIKSWFNAGLADRAMTRDMDWGIPVPESAAKLAGVDAKGKVLYVWFDAPIGYISATKEWAAKQGEPDLWKKYWQDQDTNLVHFIGKDNIVFHCLIFPALLKIHGDYVLPMNVPANEFLNLEGNKFSTSRNYAVWLEDYLKKFEADSLRYTLAVSMPETKDSDFSWRDFQARHNNELADVLGNFVNRTFTFISKYYDGKMPAKGALDELDQALLETIIHLRKKVGQAIDDFQFKIATKRFMELARFANKYFNDKEPWKTRKSDPDACATALHLCAQTAYALAVLANPFIPFASARMFRILNIDGQPESAVWDDVGERFLPDGHTFGQPEILFRKIEDEVIEKEVAILEEIRKSAAEAEAPGEDNLLDIEDFRKVDLRTAKIISAEAVPKAKKLFRLQVQLGEETRQVVAGLAEHYAAEELPGKTVILVANLKPATIRGVESRGMLLAVDDGKRLTLLSPEGDVASGKPVS